MFLGPADLRFHIQEIRACRQKAGSFELESKVGYIKLVFDKEADYTLYFRKTGSTKITIGDKEELISGETGIIYRGKDIVIKKNGCIGSIELLGIEVDEDEGNMDWKAVIKKSKKYSGIRLVNGRLYASESGWIKHDSTASIVTVPEHAAVLNDGMIKFIGACEIIELEISGTYAKKPDHIKTINSISQVKINPPRKESVFKPNTLMNLPGNSLALHAKKTEKVLETAVTLQNKNNLSIPVSAIKPNKTYIIVLEAQNINGNGKTYISINNKNPHTLIFGPLKKQYNFAISSEEGPEFNVIIDRGFAGTGSVLIHNLILKESDELQQKFPALKPDIRPPSINTFSNELEINWLKSVPKTTNVFIKPNSDRRFVIVIPSYKNENYIEKNLLSAISQNYKYYRVIFTDDCSPDSTFEKAQKIVEDNDAQLRTTLVKNKERIGALANLYNMIHSCADDEIVLTLDGDDWLSDAEVLNRLNETYKSGDTWITYGQYQNWPDGGRGISRQIPDQVITSNGFRKYEWCSSHLRTFYSWLFKSIKTEDLYYNGKFLEMTWDFAMMFPMLEMAGTHSKFIKDVNYIYNLENPINDHKVNRKLQASLDDKMRAMPKYNPVRLQPYHNTGKKIGLLLIATNKYKQYIDHLLSSADRHFFNKEGFEVKYFVFTDDMVNINTSRNYQRIIVPHKPFPYASMDRFKHFTGASAYLAEMDYLYYVDVDCLFVNDICGEVLGDLVGVRHCGYYSGGGTFERNQKSVFYRDLGSYKYYYGGGFSGGKTDKYLELSKVCSEKIEEDLRNGQMPVWHDETALNWYFADHSPLTLGPGYHYPQGQIEKYKTGWLPDRFDPKILLLDKNHKEMRS